MSSDVKTQYLVRTFKRVRFAKKSPRKIGEVENRLVVAVRPKGRKFEAVRRFFAALSGSGVFRFFDAIRSDGVGIILRGNAVRDDEDLDVLVQSATGPKTVALVAVDLIERFLNRDAAAL